MVNPLDFDIAKAEIGEIRLIDLRFAVRNIDRLCPCRAQIVAVKATVLQDLAVKQTDSRSFRKRGGHAHKADHVLPEIQNVLALRGHIQGRFQLGTGADRRAEERNDLPVLFGHAARHRLPRRARQIPHFAVINRAFRAVRPRGLERPVTFEKDPSAVRFVKR